MSSTSTPNDNTITAPTHKFSDEHVKYLEARFVRPEDAWAVGWRSLNERDWQNLKKSIPHLPSYPGVGGLIVPWPVTADGENRVRIRADRDHYFRDTVDGKGERVEIKTRWVANGKVTSAPYIPRKLLPEGWETNTSIDLFLVEAPAKALAMIHAGYAAIGMGGVEGGFHDVTEWREGKHLVANEDMQRITWTNRNVFITYDSNIHHNEGVARGAAKLAHTVRDLGANAKLVLIPMRKALDDGGPDDYLAAVGVEAFTKLVDAAVPADPVERLKTLLADAANPHETIAKSLDDLSMIAALKLGGQFAIDRFAAQCKPHKITKAAITEAIDKYDTRVTAKVKVHNPEDEWKGKLRRSTHGAIASTVANVTTVLTHDPAWFGVLAWDEFSCRIAYKKTPPWSAEAAGASEGQWSDSDDIRLCDYLGRHYGIEVSAKTVYQVAEVVAKKTRIHPVRDWLDALVWDGTERLATWLPTYLRALDKPYTRAVGRYYPIQAVARIYRPGCKADYVLILEGPQGLQKSSVAEALVPDTKWFSDSPIDIGNKDGFLSIQGLWIAELAELASMMRTETNAAKAFFTSKSDRFRPPYGGHIVNVLRSVSFLGTINPEGPYMKDATGNRRYWAVACAATGPIDYAGLKAVRDQLWAEAVHLYKASERWWPEPAEEAEHFVPEQVARQEGHPWDDRIFAGVARLNAVTVQFVLDAIVGVDTDKQDQRAANNVVKALVRQGWHMRFGKDDARKSVRLYERKEPIEKAIVFDPAWTSMNDMVNSMPENSMTAEEIERRLDPVPPPERPVVPAAPIRVRAVEAWAEPLPSGQERLTVRLATPDGEAFDFRVGDRARFGSILASYGWRGEQSADGTLSGFTEEIYVTLREHTHDDGTHKMVVSSWVGVAQAEAS